jgi:hypothetical protein
MRLPRSWWAPLVSEGIFHLQLMRAGRALRTACLAAYKFDRRRRGGFLPLHLVFAVPASRALAPEPFLPFRLCSWSRSCLQILVPPPVCMPPAAHHHHRPTGVGALDGDDAVPGSAGGRRPVGGERGGAAGGVDRAIGVGPSSQPPVRLHRQLRLLPRAQLRGAGEPLHAGPVLPLWRGAAQLHAERNLAGGHVRRRLRRLPWDPGKLGSLGPPFPCGAAYARHIGAEDSSRGARRRLGARGAEHAQGGIHPLHDDLQQRGLGAGVVLPPKRRAWPPPYTGKVLRERAASWYHGVSPPSHQARLDSLVAAL